MLCSAIALNIAQHRWGRYPVPPPDHTAPTVQHGLHVVGAHLLDETGTPVFLTGISLSGTEYICEPRQLPQVQPEQMRIMQTWGIDTIRLPLSAPYWLNTDGRCPHYREAIKSIVASAENQGMTVILELQWCAPLSDPNGGGQYAMPDRAEAVPFWSSVASDYASDGHALFELYSEPHDIDWNTWLNGGHITVAADAAKHLLAGSYDAIGMQEMTQIINARSPSRVALVSGMQWATDLSEVPFGLWIDGWNIAYAIHPYDAPTMRKADQWPLLFGDVAAQRPVIATEFGQLDCGHDQLDRLLPYLAKHTQGMIAWTWIVGDCHRPSILADWYGTPSAYGAPIAAFFSQRSNHATP